MLYYIYDSLGQTVRKSCLDACCLLLGPHSFVWYVHYSSLHTAMKFASRWCVGTCGALGCCKGMCAVCDVCVCAAVHAGFFLVLAQPFRLGDKVAVSCAVPSTGTQSVAAAAVKTPAGTAAAAAASGSFSAADAGRSSSSTPPGWFEGVCEKVDLRYTVLRWVVSLGLTTMRPPSQGGTCLLRPSVGLGGS